MVHTKRLEWLRLRVLSVPTLIYSDEGSGSTLEESDTSAGDLSLPEQGEMWRAVQNSSGHV